MVTPTPAVISPANVTGLGQEAVYALPVRGKLQYARWSQDGSLILAVTMLALPCSGEGIEQLHFPVIRSSR
jgi:hypothetical protein